MSSARYGSNTSVVLLWAQQYGAMRLLIYQRIWFMLLNAR